MSDPFTTNQAGKRVAPPSVPQRAEAARPPARHQLRPVEEYIEFEEEYKLFIPKHMYPDGFDLQWVTESVFGQPYLQHRARFERAGWVSVRTDDDGEFAKFGEMFMPGGVPGEVKQDGLVLMARPKVFSDKAKRLNDRRAVERVQIKEQQLRSGALDKVTLSPDHPEAVRRNVISRSVEPIQVPQQ